MGLSLTDQRVIEIREALNSADRPSTYGQLEEYVAIHKTHIARLVQANFDLYEALMGNKKARRLDKLRKEKAEIEAYMSANDSSASYACLALGYDASRYAFLKKELL
jgi:hypothetical protein